MKNMNRKENNTVHFIKSSSVHNHSAHNNNIAIPLLIQFYIILYCRI